MKRLPGWQLLPAGPQKRSQLLHLHQQASAVRHFLIVPVSWTCISRAGRNGTLDWHDRSWWAVKRSGVPCASLAWLRQAEPYPEAASHTHETGSYMHAPSMPVMHLAQVRQQQHLCLRLCEAWVREAGT